MNSQVDEIKQKVDIVELVGESVALKKAGRHFKGLCPFHSEKSPSFIVSPERQSYKCFGCGEGGDVISFLQQYDGMSFLESLESLANRVGVELVSYQPTAQDSQKKRLLSIMSQASEFYQYLLNTHKAGEEAREYLKERKINSEATKLYGLGYSPAQWQGVSTYLVNKKSYTMEELAAAGLVIRSESGHYYDRFRGRVMFPLRDHKGSVVGFSGRSLSADEKEAKYINSPETSIYHKSRMLYGLFENREAIRKSDQIILVEGELDVLPSYQAGVKNVVAIKGSAFTEEMGRLIARYTRNVVYALDADKAGQEAVKRAVLVADPLDLSVRVIQITGGKDPGDVAFESPANWRKMVKGATLYWDYLINTACERHDPSSGSGASSISQEVVPTLAMISNQIVKAHYAQLLAKKLSVPEESIFEEIERVDKKQKLSSLKQVVKQIEKGESVGRRDKVEEYLLSLSLQFYPSVKEKLGEIKSEWFNVPVVSKILTELVKYEGEWSIEEFGKKLKPEMIAVLDKAYLTDLSEVANSEKEWVKVRREVEEMYLRDQLKRLSGEIEKAEKGEKEKELASAQKEFSRVSKQLSEL